MGGELCYVEFQQVVMFANSGFAQSRSGRCWLGWAGLDWRWRSGEYELWDVSGLLLGMLDRSFFCSFYRFSWILDTTIICLYCTLSRKRKGQEMHNGVKFLSVEEHCNRDKGEGWTCRAGPPVRVGGCGGQPHQYPARPGPLSAAGPGRGQQTAAAVLEPRQPATSARSLQQQQETPHTAAVLRLPSLHVNRRFGYYLLFSNSVSDF